MDNFRWMADEADLFVRVPGGGGTLRMEIEAGPGVGPPPQPLHVIDEAGNVVAKWLIAGRTLVRLDVPAPPDGGPRRIRFRAPLGGSPVVHDPRITNFRFFRCEWMDPNAPDSEVRPLAETIRAWKPTLARMVESRIKAGVARFLLNGPLMIWRGIRLLRLRGPDIFDRGAEFQLGGGWQHLETVDGYTFRWAHYRSEIMLRFRDGTTSLGLLVEPGPSLGYLPFDLVLRLNGEEQGRVRVNGITYAQFVLPIRRDEQITVGTEPGENRERGGPADSGRSAYVELPGVGLRPRHHAGVR